MGFLYYTLLILLIFVALLLIGLILIQKGRGGGLSGAFGGGGGGSAAFGAKTGDVLTWLTSSFFALFIILAVCLDLVVNSHFNLTNIANPSAAVGNSMFNTGGAPPSMGEATQPSTPIINPLAVPATPPAAAGPAVNSPAAEAGGALDRKLEQAAGALRGTVSATTQKAAAATQPK